MEMKDILRAIADEMGETQLNDVILAAGRGFERVHPQMELVCIAIPKYNKKQRRKVLRNVYRTFNREDEIAK